MHGVYMFKAAKRQKQHLSCNDLIIKGMFKRRKLAYSMIAHICDDRQPLRVVK